MRLGPSSLNFFQVVFTWEVTANPTKVKSVYQKIIFSYFSTKTYIVGTQKNRLNETILLKTQDTCLNWWITDEENNPKFMLKFFT